MAADNLEFPSLLVGKDAVNRFLNLCNRRYSPGRSNNCIVMADALLPNTLLNTSSSLKLKTVRQF